MRQHSTAMLKMSCRMSGRRTGAYFSDLVQIQSLWLPRTTIHALAQWGCIILSGLIVSTHIVGMAWGAPFSHKALYSARMSLLYVSSDSIPAFSSRKLRSHVSQSGWVAALAVSRDWGQSWIKLAALTKLADDVSQTKLLAEWPGSRIPSVHNLCQVASQDQI